jgi:hypothetical protein
MSVGALDGEFGDGRMLPQCSAHHGPVLLHPHADEAHKNQYSHKNDRADG